MEGTSLFKTARGWSWVLGISSVLLPSAFYVWQAHQFSQWAKAQEAYVCGMPLLAAILLAALLAGTLSMAALAFGIVAFRKLPKRRPRGRLLELLLVGFPALLLTLGLIAGSISAL